MQKIEQPSLFPLIKFCKYTSLFSLFRGNTLWKRSNFPKSQGDTKQPSQVHLVAGEQCRNQSWVHMNCSIWDFGHERMYVRKISWKVTSSSLSKFAFFSKMHSKSSSMGDAKTLYLLLRTWSFGDVLLLVLYSCPDLSGSQRFYHRVIHQGIFGLNARWIGGPQLHRWVPLSIYPI